MISNGSSTWFPTRTRHGFERIETNLVATYARSKFEDTRRKAIKYGAPRNHR
jgi:hypothetical protein